MAKPLEARGETASSLQSSKMFIRSVCFCVSVAYDIVLGNLSVYVRSRKQTDRSTLFKEAFDWSMDGLRLFLGAISHLPSRLIKQQQKQRHPSLQMYHGA